MSLPVYITRSHFYPFGCQNTKGFVSVRPAAAALWWCQTVYNIPSPPLAAGLLAWLHADDPVSAGGLLHPGGVHPDDRVGQGKAPQLPEGVPRLPSSPLTHRALHPVEDHMVAHPFSSTSPPQTNLKGCPPFLISS